MQAIRFGLNSPNAASGVTGKPLHGVYCLYEARKCIDILKMLH